MTNIVPVPAAALAIDNQEPQTGDPVDFSVSGKIDRIEGPIAYVAVDTVNGAPLPANDETSPEDMSEDQMRGMAEQADKLPFGSP